mgnify:CR=1 FL=1
MVTIDGSYGDVLVQYLVTHKPENPGWIREPENEATFVGKIQDGRMTQDWDEILERNAVYPRKLAERLTQAGYTLCDVFMLPRPSFTSMFTEPLPSDLGKSPTKVTFVFRRSTGDVSPERLALLAQDGLAYMEQSLAQKRWGTGKVRCFKPKDRPPFTKIEFRDLVPKGPNEVVADDPAADGWGFDVTSKKKKATPPT